MEICRHAKVIVEPTLDTTWGREDRCRVKCAICHQPIYSTMERYECWLQLQHDQRVVVQGRTYL